MCQPREFVEKLMSHAFRRRIRGYGEVDWTPAIVGKNQNDEKQPERGGGDYEEICRDQILHVVFQECFPSLRTRPTFAPVPSPNFKTLPGEAISNTVPYRRTIGPPIPKGSVVGHGSLRALTVQTFTNRHSTPDQTRESGSHIWASVLWATRT